MRPLNPAGNAAPPSPYSHGALVEGRVRLLHTAGQVGRLPDGSIAAGFEAQCRQAWANLANILAEAGMGMADVVKLTFLLTDRGDMATLRRIWEEQVGEHRPPATMLIVAGLGRAEVVFEIEAVAAQELAG